MIERTLVILKPDADERRLYRVILEEIRSLGLKIEDYADHLNLPEDLVRAHYAHHAGKPYFPRILAYMTRGPSMAIVWRGEDAVAKVRNLVGATRPDEADPASIRGRFGRITPEGGIENVIHCSATPEEAVSEIALFFPSIRPA